jgi:hypothetical protein
MFAVHAEQVRVELEGTEQLSIHLEALLLKTWQSVASGRWLASELALDWTTDRKTLGSVGIGYETCDAKRTFAPRTLARSIDNWAIGLIDVF